MAERLDAIDQFRGGAILLMVLANFLAGSQAIPAWLKHAPDVGLTVTDLVAPLFIFAIGLTYRLSARRRVRRDGVRATARHFVLRYALLCAIGFVLTTGEIALGLNPGGVNWGVLQSIAVAGLLALPLLGLPAWARAGAGLALLAAYQAALDRLWLPLVLGAPHGGVLGALGWTAMLVLATALADLYHGARRGWYAGASVLVLAAGLALALLVPVSKNRVSASYVLISLGASALLFAVFHLLARRGLRAAPLSAWGRNPLALYCLHLVLLGVFALPPVPAWYYEAPLWLVLLQAGALLAALSAVGREMLRRGWVLAL